MTGIDTSPEAVEALIKSNWACRAPDAAPAILLRALISERDTLQAQLNSPAHAARVTDSVMAQRLRDKLHVMGCMVPADMLHHALRAIALDTTTATCDNTREGE